MSEKILKRMLYVVLIAAVGFTGYFAGVLHERSGSTAGSYATEALKMKKLSNLIDTEYYFQDHIDHETAFRYAMDGYVSHLRDPFSMYIAENDLQEFNEDIEGSYVGIGIEITVDEGNFITVINSFDGSAAQEAGITTGDRIIGVNGTAVYGEQLNEVVNEVRGKPGEPIDLKVMKSTGEEVDLTLIRREVSVETIRTKWLEDGIGYVRISSFDTGTDAEFIEKMKTFDTTELRGLIIDLRSNSGGTLDSVVRIADELMPEGLIVSAKYTDGTQLTEQSDAEHCVEVPICVLVNEGTASAAELLAGALRNNNGAKLIGKNTFGKGVIGSMFSIDSESAVILTVGEYFLPDGSNIHKVGLKPDIEIDIKNQNTSLFLLAENEDTQLQKAIEELK